MPWLLIPFMLVRAVTVWGAWITVLSGNPGLTCPKYPAAALAVPVDHTPLWLPTGITGRRTGGIIPAQARVRKTFGKIKPGTARDLIVRFVWHSGLPATTAVFRD